MSCDIEFEDWVEDTIDSWGVPNHILDSLSEQFEKQLAVDPLNYLRRVVAGPHPTMQYSCPILEDTEPPRAHTFIFRFRWKDSADENTLVAWDAIYLGPGFED